MQHFKKNGKLIWISLFIAAAGFLAFMLPASNQLKIRRQCVIAGHGNTPFVIWSGCEWIWEYHPILFRHIDVNFTARADKINP
jgi:hypothetical protein